MFETIGFLVGCFALYALAAIQPTLYIAALCTATSVLVLNQTLECMHPPTSLSHLCAHITAAQMFFSVLVRPCWTHLVAMVTFAVSLAVYACERHADVSSGKFIQYWALCMAWGYSMGFIAALGIAHHTRPIIAALVALHVLKSKGSIVRTQVPGGICSAAALAVLLSLTMIQRTIVVVVMLIYTGLILSLRRLGCAMNLNIVQSSAISAAILYSGIEIAKHLRASRTGWNEDVIS